jgi:hypothetical protein
MSTYTNPLMDYSPQMEFNGSAGSHFAAPAGGVFSEAHEMDLATDLLGVNSEEELEQFLGSLIHDVGKTLGKVVKSPIGQAIGGVLKGVAKAALPVAGGALGTMVGGPVGGMIGSKLASVADGALGLELEGLSPEDREFEASRRFVQFAGQTVANALDAPPFADPRDVAHEAAVEAAREFAPGLMDITGNDWPQRHHHSAPHTGPWRRHGDRITLFGV